MDDLHPIRLFYRRYLSKYVWARRLKPIALTLWFAYLQIRHIVVWRFCHTSHVLAFAITQRSHALSLVMARMKHRFAEKAHYFATQRSHALNLAMARMKCRLAGDAHYFATQRSHALGLAMVRQKYRFAEIANYLAAIMIGGLGVLAFRVASRWSSSLTTNIRFFSMVTFHEYCDGSKPAVSLLTKAETFPLAMPAVFPAEYRENLYSKMWPLDVPSVHAIEIFNAEIMGKCDFIFSGLQCLHHGCYRFEHDLPAEEMHGMVSINDKKGLLVRHRNVDEQSKTLPVAISMIGSASPNYVHWLTETAPKLALIDEIENYADFPLVIDAGLHPNILESIHCLNSRKRELIFIKPGQIFRVNKLVAVTPVAYIPFDFRGGDKRGTPEINPGLAMYVPDGLNLMRQKLVSRFGDQGAEHSTRLYLRRTAKSRQMSNAVEVEALLQEQGFQIVEPETLSFTEQVRLFSRAEIIVGQGGAAFGNIIFAPKGCHIVFLTTWSPYTIYYYFSNLASVLGQRCSIVLCDPVEELDSFHRAHKGLNVDIHNLKKAIGL